ncbi:MAG TPA: hypothetical protein VIH61_03735 [Waddliaceae bacterium]
MASKATESLQVQKARKKLEKKLISEQKQLNIAAIEQMKRAIQIWISRHQAERVTLQQKAIELFDENQHSAKTRSRYVVHLLNKLRKEEQPKSLKLLKGRITK